MPKSREGSRCSTTKIIGFSWQFKVKPNANWKTHPGHFSNSSHLQVITNTKSGCKWYRIISAPSNLQVRETSIISIIEMCYFKCGLVRLTSFPRLHTTARSIRMRTLSLCFFCIFSAPIKEWYKLTNCKYLLCHLQDGECQIRDSKYPNFKT